LNTSLEKAIDWDLILKNPLRKVDLPKWLEMAAKRKVKDTTFDHIKM